MQLTEKLATFLQNRVNRTAPFLLGHWLSALDEATLADLRHAIRANADGQASSHIDDLFTLISLAMSAETQRCYHGVDGQLLQSWAQTLRVVVGIEAYRRKGWLILDRPLSIQPDSNVCLRLTHEGLKHSVDFRPG
ncbi:MAG: hypothetical protein ABIP34_08300 [Rhodoferax sp.]|uniref:hypothetical protein n=1 Tax=Rhodoferax sp. TaxID=50421 RepID=UPI0032673CC3